MGAKKPRRRPVERRGPVKAKPTTQQSAEERQLIRPVRLPSLPTFRPVRPLNFRMPELPSLRMPSLPTFRRPSFPQLSNPSSTPLAPSFRPSAQNNPIIPPVETVPSIPVPDVQSQSAPLSLPNPQPAAPSSFGSSFDNDPFSEFQSADFGSDASFRELISAQFGESFDLQRLPSSRSDKE